MYYVYTVIGKEEEVMQPYVVDKIKDRKDTFFLIRESTKAEIVASVTKYLAYRVKMNKSPNTDRKSVV